MKTGTLTQVTATFTSECKIFRISDAILSSSSETPFEKISPIAGIALNAICFEKTSVTTAPEEMTALVCLYNSSIANLPAPETD